MSNIITENSDATFAGTMALDLHQDLAVELSPWQRLVRRYVPEMFRGSWSATSFPEAEVSEYAEKLMLEETRRGITLMAILSLFIQIAAAALHQKLGFHGSVLYTYGLLSLLSLHVVIAARFTHDTKALNLLGTVLLVITGVALMAIAHRTGNLNTGLLSSVVLLFMVVPLVPWGLREASLVVALIYATLTTSTLSVTGRFESETLWTMQFLIIAAALVALVVIARATVTRKENISGRYALETAHQELQLVSTRDPLTSAWNRRYLDQNFKAIARRARVEGKDLYFALLDVDAFKQLNDSFGHHHGDEILRRLVQVLQDNLPGTAHVLRLGGDEFAVLDTSEHFEESVRRCLGHLETDPHLLAVSATPVRVSTGFAKAGCSEIADLDSLYHAADKALYERKEARQNHAASGAWRAVPV
jgi:diguanylate cyclase (GGDEF)-like protein